MSDQQMDNMVSLRHYVETLMAQYKHHHAREHELLAESVEHARGAIDARLQSMNEFRAQILSERGTMMLRETYETRHEAVEKRIGALEKGQARLAGVGAAVGVGLVIVQIVLKLVVK